MRLKCNWQIFKKKFKTSQILRYFDTKFLLFSNYTGVLFWWRRKDPIHFLWPKITQNAHFALLVYAPKFDEVKMKVKEFQKKHSKYYKIYDILTQYLTFSRTIQVCTFLLTNTQTNKQTNRTTKLIFFSGSG